MNFVPSSFNVKAGDLLRALTWNAAGKILRAMRLIAGWNVRLTETPSGTLINFVASAQIFDHPFRGKLQGINTVFSNYGTINNIPCTIKDSKTGLQTPLDIKNGSGSPILRWEKLLLDGKGYGWIAAEVTCDEDWHITGVEIVQVADLESEDGKAKLDGTVTQPSGGGVKGISKRRARWGLMVIFQDPKTTELTLWQNTFANLKHRVRVDIDGKSYHFFYL